MKLRKYSLNFRYSDDTLMFLNKIIDWICKMFVKLYNIAWFDNKLNYVICNFFYLYTDYLEKSNHSHDQLFKECMFAFEDIYIYGTYKVNLSLPYRSCSVLDRYVPVPITVTITVPVHIPITFHVTVPERF